MNPLIIGPKGLRISVGKRTTMNLARLKYRLIIFQHPYILRINPTENIVKRYTNRDSSVHTLGQFDTSQSYILLSDEIDHSTMFYLVKTEDVLHTYVDEMNLYTVQSNMWCFVLLGLFSLSAGYLVYRGKVIRARLPSAKNAVHITQSHGSFYINRRPLEEYFDGYALILLLAFLNRPDENISLQELDDLCNPKRTASGVSLKKRSEHALLTINEKLAINLNCDPSSIFTEKRDITDKRLKIIKLNTSEILRVQN